MSWANGIYSKKLRASVHILLFLLYLESSLKDCNKFTSTLDSPNLLQILVIAANLFHLLQKKESHQQRVLLQLSIVFTY